MVRKVLCVATVIGVMSGIVSLAADTTLRSILHDYRLTTVADALIIAGRALLAGALAQPLAWAGAVLALGMTAAWLVALRKLVPEGLAK